MKKSFMFFILLILVSISCFFSCGGAIPETPPETPAVTPETVTTPVTPDEPITPDAPDIQPRDPNEVLSELLPVAIDAFDDYWLTLTEDALFLSVEQAESIAADPPKLSDILTVVGQPHVSYYEDSWDEKYALISRSPEVYYYYVLENGAILEYYVVGYSKYEVTIYNPNTRLYYDISRLRLSYTYDPFQTHTAIYAELENRQYMQIISRHPKRFFSTDVEKVTNQMTLNQIIALLGTPNFMQVEEMAPPDMDVNPRVFYIYVLVDGHVLIVYGGAHDLNSQASYAQILRPDDAIQMISEIMYY